MENTTSKVTVAQNFANVKAFLEENGAPQAMVEFIVDRAEKSTRKSSGETKAQKEARELSRAIAEKAYDFLSGNEDGMTITELINAIDLGSTSAPKVTSALRTDGRFSATKVGKRSVYKVVAE